jgi:hypothetical protein
VSVGAELLSADSSDETPAGTLVAETPAGTLAVETSAGTLAARLQRAGALFDDRRLPEAEAELQEALRLAPDDLRAWRLLARVRLRLGRLDDARAAFAAIAARVPEDGEARLQLGLVACKAHDFAAAAVELEAAVRLRPTDVRAQQYLAYAWAHLGRAGEAAATFEAAGAPELAAVVRAGGEAAAAPEELPIASLAADNLLPRESGIPEGSRLASGVHRLVVDDVSETHVVAAALLTMLGDVTLEPAVRRRPGRMAEAIAVAAPMPRYVRCRGQGEIWVAGQRRGTPLLSLRLEADSVCLRESRVLGFAGPLAWAAGEIPRDGTQLLQFDGRGVVLVDFAAADVVAVHVSLAHRPKVPGARLLGWLGSIVLQPDDAAGAALTAPAPGRPGPRLGGPSTRVFACEGEGVLLIARHGQAEQPVHERAEPGHHGAGRPDPGDPDLHR